MKNNERRSASALRYFDRSLFLGQGIGWLINLRWTASSGLLVVIWLISGPLEVIKNPLPLYFIGVLLLVYNFILFLLKSRLAGLQGEKAELIIFAQIAIDLLALTLLLYFSDISRNPFIFYYSFHIIIAGILLPVRYSYFAALLASVMAGSVIYMQHAELIQSHLLALSTGNEENGVMVTGKIFALSSTLFLNAFFTHYVLEQVRKAENDIRRQDKLLSLGKLVSGIIHQIRNPLDGLKNCLHILADGRRPAAECERYTKLMNDELNRIERLTERLQDYASSREVKLTEIDVNEQVLEALSLLEIKCRDGITIKSELDDRLPPVCADPQALQEIVLNLCRNAIDAMPEGGRLVVRTGIKSTGDQERIVISVTDTGDGLDRWEIDKIFEAFYTTKVNGEGTGLGLWICRTLAAQMGAKLAVESLPGMGSAFSISFPASRIRS